MPSDKKIKIIQVSDVAYFYCPAEIKEIAEIIVTGPAKFFLLLLQFLRDLKHAAREWNCPAEIKEIAEIIVTDPREAFLLFLLFLRDIIITCR